MLQRIFRREIYTRCSREVAELLYALVKDGGKPFALELLDQANCIASDVWQTLQPDATGEEIKDWLGIAVNRPAGVIVEFWINGLALLMRGKTGTERTLPLEYRNWFTTVIETQTVIGGYGRTILASQTAFLFGLDETWTRQCLIPLFEAQERQKFSQVWNGFLFWGRLFPALAEVLRPAFIAALPRLTIDLHDHRRRFVEFFAALAVFHVDDPTQQLMPALFQHGNAEDRVYFAARVGTFLRQMPPDAVQQLWGRWLHRYWQDRLQSVPASLSNAESKRMLEWLLYLGDAFPAAVQLATRKAPLALEHSNFLHALKESDLVSRFPAATAQLLIFICEQDLHLYFCTDILAIARRVSSGVLTAELDHALREAIARAGCTGGP
jgi:hypothetical protein